MKNIYLVGMPSSGKSTLGKELARNLGYSFTDMDKLIETREQKTVSEIFSNYGEAHFREIEKKTLRGFQPNHPWLSQQVVEFLASTITWISSKRTESASS